MINMHIYISLYLKKVFVYISLNIFYNLIVKFSS